MIEPTQEMVHAFIRAYAQADDGSARVILEDTAEKAGLAAALAIAERDQAAALKKIKTSIDMHATGAGRFIARIVLDCECGAWGVTTTLASWSSLASITEPALLHLGYCRGQQVPITGSQPSVTAPQLSEADRD